MAEVFLGSTVGAEGFSRKVAIKRVLPGFSDNPSFASMFVAEAQISAQLQHPNIVSVLDFDRDAESRLFLVMELVEGRDLDALLSTGILPFGVVVFTITEVLRGLGHAHDLPVGGAIRGIVHRDVSPHNVLLSWEGAVKVSDFGIAKARAASEATASVFIKGKPAYMSPEQANGERLDGRSDLFAVGVMLWEMLVGRRLFTGDDTRATLAAVLFGQIPRPRSVRPDVPADLERVTMKLLERDLPARYPSAEDAISELLDCADAPKNGRELLVRVLAERFPQAAPVRSSHAHHRRDQSQPAMPNAPTIAAPAGSTPHAIPITPMPSLGEIRGAATGTLDPRNATTMPGGPRKSRVGVLVAVGLVSLAASFGVVMGVTKSKTSDGAASASTGSGSSSGSAAVVAAAPPAQPIDAGVPVATDASIAAAPPPPDAAVAVAVVAPITPQKDAAAAHPGHPAAVGQITVRNYPIANILIDNRSYGDTPQTFTLPVGHHKLHLVNPDAGVDKTLSITISATQPTLVDNPR